MAETEELRNLDIEIYEDPIKAAEIYGVAKTRKKYEDAISEAYASKSDDRDQRIKALYLKYIELETSLQEIERARSIYTHASQFSNPRTDLHFWNLWHDFEVQHGSELTFREMIRIKRVVGNSLYPLINPAVNLDN